MMSYVFERLLSWTLHAWRHAVPRRSIAGNKECSSTEMIAALAMEYWYASLSLPDGGTFIPVRYKRHCVLPNISIPRLEEAI